MNYSSSALTFYFQDIFPTYEEWKYTVESEGIVNYEDTEQASLDEYCYKLLSRQYHNCNIRYSTINDFLGALFNVYANKFFQFKRELELTKKLYALTEQELLQVNEALSNNARNPNNLVDDPTLPVKWFGEQVYSSLKGSKLDTYLKSLENLPSLRIFKFFERSGEEMGFNDLFMQVLPNQKFYYEN